MLEAGLRVIKSLIPIKVSDRASTRADRVGATKWTTVYPYEWTFGPRPRRIQSPIENARLIQDVEGIVLPAVMSINPCFQVRSKSWFFFKTLKGCDAQQIHRDFLQSELEQLPEESIPYCIAICIRNNNYIATYGWNRMTAERQEEKLHTLQVGDALIFRGDMIHRELQYPEEGIQMYCILDAVQHQCEINLTQFVFFRLFRCPNCNQAFELHT
jgi:hypothetical protein